MKAFNAMFVIELKLASRNFIYMFFNFVFPPMIILLFGSIFGNEPSEFYGGYGAVDVLTPSYIPMIIAVAGLMGLPLQLAFYRHSKVLKRYRATPIGTGTIMWPHLLINVILCIAGIVVLLAVCKVAFGLNFMGNVLEFSAALFMSIAAVFSLGFMIAAVAPTNRSANLVANMVYFPMLFLSGSSVPRQLFPVTVATVSKVLPLTHSVTLLQGVWLGGRLGDFGAELAILGGFTLVFTVISLKVFRWE